MKQAWRWVRQWWWVIVAAVAGILGLVWRIMAAQPKRGGDGVDPLLPPPPTLTERANVEVERVRLEGEVEKARVTATADAHRAELDRIEETAKADPAAARRQLAGFLAKNL